MIAENIKKKIDTICNDFRYRPLNRISIMELETTLNHELSELELSEEVVLFDWDNVQLIYKDSKVIGVDTLTGAILENDVGLSLYRLLNSPRDRRSAYGPALHVINDKN